MKKHSKIKLWGTHTPTILSITLVLFVMGLLLLLEYHSYRLTQDAQERITYKVDIAPDADTLSINQIIAEIEGMPYVKHFDYISKEEAADIFSADIGDDFVKFLGFNPLYPSIMVNFQADLLPENTSQVIGQFTATMKKHPCVTDISYQEIVVGELYQIFHKLTWFLIIFIIMLLIVCILMIRSTIRIALYAQRNTITTMRLVGATIGFVSRPFLWRSLLYGLFGGIFAVLLLGATAYAFDLQLSLSILTSRHYMWYGLMAAGIILIGMVITWSSTALAIRHYLKKDIQ